MNLTVIKKSEDNDCLILRGVEYSGIRQKIKLRIYDAEYTLDIDPYEIFTVAFDGEGIHKTDMLEN